LDLGTVGERGKDGEADADPRNEILDYASAVGRMKHQKPEGAVRPPSFKSQLMMPEQRHKKNDRERNPQQPKQCTSTETHVSLHVFVTANRTYEEHAGSDKATNNREWSSNLQVREPYRQLAGTLAP
jgi:hypothetical protein